MTLNPRPRLTAIWGEGCRSPDDPFWMTTRSDRAVTTIIDIFPDSRSPTGLTVRAIHRDDALGNYEIEFGASRENIRAMAQFLLRRLRENPEPMAGISIAAKASTTNGDQEKDSYENHHYRKDGGRTHAGRTDTARPDDGRV